jgi:hypothetical protein
LSIYCAMAGHKASAATIRNGGHHFARCTRCGADLVEHDDVWTTAPKGYRIVWRAPERELVEPGADANDVEAIDLNPETVEFRTLELIDEAPEPDTLLLTEEATEPEELDPFGFPPLPEAIAPERRSGDRRAPEGSQPKFTGVDRRRGDRRADFGKKAFAPPSRRAASGGLA